MGPAAKSWGRCDNVNSTSPLGDSSLVTVVEETKRARRNVANEANRHKRERQRALGRELRRFFESILREPVPDRFLDQLRKIGKDHGQGGEDSGEES